MNWINKSPISCWRMIPGQSTNLEWCEVPARKWGWCWKGLTSQGDIVLALNGATYFVDSLVFETQFIPIGG